MRGSRHVGRLDGRRTCWQGGSLVGNRSRSSKSWIHKAESHPNATNLVLYYETCSTNKCFIRRRRNEGSSCFNHALISLSINVAETRSDIMRVYFKGVWVFNFLILVMFLQFCFHNIKLNYMGTFRGKLIKKGNSRKQHQNRVFFGDVTSCDWYFPLMNFTRTWNSVTILMVGLIL